MTDALAVSLTLLLLGGCTPFVSAGHLSDPGVEGDGYDLACAGLKHYDGRLTVKAAGCKNLGGGNVATASIEYDLTDHD